MCVCVCVRATSQVTQRVLDRNWRDEYVALRKDDVDVNSLTGDEADNYRKKICETFSTEYEGVVLHMHFAFRHAICHVIESIYGYPPVQKAEAALLANNPFSSSAKKSKQKATSERGLTKRTRGDSDQGSCSEEESKPAGKKRKSQSSEADTKIKHKKAAAAPADSDGDSPSSPLAQKKLGTGGKGSSKPSKKEGSKPAIKKDSVPNAKTTDKESPSKKGVGKNKASSSKPAAVEVEEEEEEDDEADPGQEEEEEEEQDVQSSTGQKHAIMHALKVSSQKLASTKRQP